MVDEATARKILEVAISVADGYRRSTDAPETNEKCAIAASNTAWFALNALGFSSDQIRRMADEVRNDHQ